MLPIKMFHNNFKKKKKKGTQTTTGVCLVVAVGLTQDLTLILSTKNTKQNKERKRNPSKNSPTAKESGEGFIVMDIYAVCYCQQEHL